MTRGARASFIIWPGSGRGAARALGVDDDVVDPQLARPLLVVLPAEAHGVERRRVPVVHRVVRDAPVALADDREIVDGLAVEPETQRARRPVELPLDARPPVERDGRLRVVPAVALRGPAVVVGHEA